VNSTELIYHAAMITPTIKIRDGKRVKYSDIEAEEVKDDTCWLCGGSTYHIGVPTKKAIKNTFTDHNLAKAPHSKAICKSCAFCLSYRELRNYSILATLNWLMHPDRASIKHWLLNPPEPPFVFCVAESGQKWLHIKADVAHDKYLFPVQFEDMRVHVDSRLLKELLYNIEMLYSNGFSKKEIETGHYYQKRIQEFGIGNWRDFEDKLKEQRSFRLFKLAIFVAQKNEEFVLKGEDKECITTSTQKTSMKQQQLC